ncbi:hypothetical protein L6164_034985 [Bauhinia variegata]|uniref:Uncharacterized protein n=1 Tax=Bauhinia variegata TaxID=167791 RepID=A0ACB9KXY6_BAUVA|nr:hypothetical protein L6164_034985 [Bauhinia variegata]
MLLVEQLVAPSFLDRDRDRDRDRYRLRGEKDYGREREGRERERRDRDRDRERGRRRSYSRSRSRSRDRREREGGDYRKRHARSNMSPRRHGDEELKKKDDGTDHPDPEIAEQNRLRASLGLKPLK